MSSSSNYDLVVIGGGIHGVGVAADAQGRGLKVLLCEQADLASATSSASSKMIHGGLRYLAQYHFSLVKDALAERQRLTQLAPHLVQAQSFMIPYRPLQQPLWMLRAGLFFYDLFGARSPFKRSALLSLNQHPTRAHIQTTSQRALTYSDATVDDARLVVTNAIRFKELGGTLLTRTACIDAKVQNGSWQITLQNTQTQNTTYITAKAVVNAAGPWVSALSHKVFPKAEADPIRFIKGSHIVIRNRYPKDHAFLLRHHDGRAVFVIPYHEDFALIGTTDIAYEGDPNKVCISPEEIQYLQAITKSYLQPGFSEKDIIASWSGVRTLIDENDKDPQKNSREYKLDLKTHQGAAWLNIIGGKLTTYRLVAEKAMNMLTPFFKVCSPPWTAATPLPGGFIPTGCPTQYLLQLKNKYAWLPETTITRYFRQFGTRIHHLLQGCSQISDLGTHFGADLYENEIRYLMFNEWAMTAEDVLWRRTKLGLVLSKNEQDQVQQWLQTQLPTATT